MKKLLIAAIAWCGAMSSQAQDTTATEKVDTIHVGGMIILKKQGKDKEEKDGGDKEIIISTHNKKKPSNLSTNWWIMDFGFSNINENTNYSSAEAQAFAPGFTKEQLKLKTGKSVNVNIWFFMQRLNLIKHVVNLKYGLGLELNNYHFENETVRLSTSPTIITLDPALQNVGKNKLAADYITVPMMLNFNLTPKQDKGFGFSAGISAGFLYDARQKVKADEKNKVHDDFDLNQWKLSYVGELNLGPVRLYGSYAIESMWEKGLDQMPYNVGIRFSSW